MQAVCQKPSICLAFTCVHVCVHVFVCVCLQWVRHNSCELNQSVNVEVFLQQKGFFPFIFGSVAAAFQKV